MQLFNKNEGTFTPDALIVSPDFPILTGGIGLTGPQCRGGYDPLGVLRFAPSSVSLRSTASPLRGEAYKARLPSLPPTGGKVARRAG